MNPRVPLIASALLAASLISGAAHAALLGRDLDGNAATAEAYYDTDLNITWLADANYAQTSGYDSDGTMTWSEATTWAANLSYYDSVRNVTYNDWRLPSSDTCIGYDCANSEMGHMFYIELSGTAGQPILSSLDPDLGKFTHIQSGHYWSGTEYEWNTFLAPPPTVPYVWSFDQLYGSQDVYPSDINLYAWAVRPGDIAAVPEADTWAMLLAGLGLVGFVTRRRKLAKV